MQNKDKTWPLRLNHRLNSFAAASAAIKDGMCPRSPQLATTDIRIKARGIFVEKNALARK
jgi:hypothetical protein